MKLSYSIGVILFLLLAWEMAVRLEMADPIFIPPPSKVILTFWQEWPLYVGGLAITLKRAAIEFCLGVPLALVCGLGIGWYKKVEATIKPTLFALSVIPIFTFLPLFVLWFGLGDGPIMAGGVLAVFYPALLGTVAAVKRIDMAYIEVAKNLGFSSWRTLIHVVTPAAMPGILQGVKTSLSYVFLYTPGAEILLGNAAGLGGIIHRSASLFRIEYIMAAQMVLAVAGVAIYAVYDWLVGRALLKWQHLYN